ncbi:acyl-CoA N-acyltransferase [Mycena rosella]|uniref:Acyl-CoA N-acyltransferase n=1 Tax=Mycena rosella TaxID=1033263 RepID=A0AAD7CVQ4_MYCRO|nr:acyl-CoA N-acyltransferase [Mycena rosella]
MISFCENVLETDMHDISVHYRPPAAFFVAAQPRAAKADDETATSGDEEVVGYVGLEYLPEKDAQIAEVRRMIVSAKRRRHGIGARLMQALIAHGETIPGLRWIELGTSDYQLGAQRFYTRLGWEVFRVETVRQGVVSATIRQFRRPVGTA